MRSRWLRVPAVLVVVAALVWANRHELPAAGRALRHADPRLLGRVLLIWIVDRVLPRSAARRVRGEGGCREFARLQPVTPASKAQPPWRLRASPG